MNLKVLNINFLSKDEFLDDIRGAIFGENESCDKEDELNFDSFESFKRFMSQNKLQILMAISQLKPESIYQLEKRLNRKYPHVLKDCRQLESFGFIELVESEGAKKQLCPKLIFDFDIIKVNSSLEEVFSISERSKRTLLEA